LPGAVAAGRIADSRHHSALHVQQHLMFCTFAHAFCPGALRLDQCILPWALRSLPVA
jgi:hypothetical protein